MRISIEQKYYDTDTNEIKYVLKINREYKVINQETFDKLLESNTESGSEEIKIINNTPLKGRTTDLTGEQIGEWRALEYLGDKTWKCQCSCGTIKNVGSASLIKRTSLSCGHNTTGFKDLSGMKFGELEVIEYMQNGLWRCKCSCGREHLTSGFLLRTGQSKSCGHSTTGFKDLTGRHFGEWEALEYNKETKKWRCRCSCGIIREVKASSLTHGRSKSCGHNTNKLSDIQILDTDSQYKLELYRFIESIIQKKNEIYTHSKKVLGNQELDIYIPEKNLAIEYVGTYQNNSLVQDLNYHQDKVIACARKGVRLVHIFEYEWIDSYKKEKICNFLRDILAQEDARVIYGRNTRISDIPKEMAYEFENKYHLQGKSSSTINYGCFYKDELLGVMTFGSPRFNNSFDYELVRMCWKHKTRVIGGSEKLFKHFIKEFNPRSIISYCDIARFSGGSYMRMGFRCTSKDLTRPNYVWISWDGTKVLPRYQTQKQKLLKLGMGTPDQTENEIMIQNGYYKVYDAGNLRLEWYSGMTK